MCSFIPKFGGLPLPCCWSSQAFSSRICFKLLKPLSRLIESLYSFSVRYHAKNRVCLSYKQLRKTPWEFYSGPPAHTFISVFWGQTLGQLILCWMFLLLAYYLKLWIKKNCYFLYTCPLFCFVVLNRNLPVNQCTLNFLHKISTLCTVWDHKIQSLITSFVGSHISVQ